MNSIIIPPNKILSDYISHFWTGKWNSLGINNATYYSPADSMTELIFAFKQTDYDYPELLFSYIQGQTNNHQQFTINESIDLFGVSVNPYALPRLFGIPATELTNHFIELDIMFSNNGKILNEKMAQTRTTNERIEVMSNYLLAQLKRMYNEDTNMIQAIKEINLQKGAVNINELAKKFCLSKKQFERRFRACSGFNPKLYSKIIRFENALYHLLTDFDTFSEVAYTQGYYDQAHFNHEFKSFSGFSPQKYISITNN